MNDNSQENEPRSEQAQSAAAAIIGAAPLGIVITRRDEGTIMLCNDLAGQFLGRSAGELIGQHIHDFFVEPGQRVTLRGRLADNSSIVHQELPMRRHDGQEFTAMLHLSVMEFAGTVAVQIILEDVSQQKSKESELEASYQLLQSLIDGMPEFIALKDANGRYLFVNKVFEEWYGVSRAQAIGTTMYDYLESDEADIYRGEEDQASNEHAAIHREVEAAWPDGKTRNTIMIRFPVFDDGGNVIARGSSGRDVTQLRRTEAAAAAAQEQLRQAQKMEAVGQLTGGIAHDFNNLLAAIMGNLELLQDHVEGDSGAAKFTARALSAAKRGAALTHRLLAFSRRQDLRPVAVDINQLVAGMDDLLARTLGAEVEITLTGEPGLWPCEIDPGQMENAILNLSINARDAMPEGGQLRIVTSNVELSAAEAAEIENMKPGGYVRLAISDTGVGMDQVQVEQAFDPFFTTKDVGKGSGLGLSMVYGFAKQSGGLARILSKPGKGTTIEVFLPRTKSPVVQGPIDTAKPTNHRAGAGEVILVVEDNKEVRALTTTFLRSCGYRVHEAQNAGVALIQIRQKQRIDLMLTDILMPGGMDGTKLVRQARLERADLKFLYMSGYAKTSPSLQDPREDDVPVLMKPFALAELGAKIRALLAVD